MFMQNDSTKLLPIDQAAAQLGTTPLNILMHVKRGLIEGRELDGQWFVDAVSLAGFADAHGGASRSLCHSHCAKAGGCGSACA